MAEQDDNDRRICERMLAMLNHDLRTPLSTILTGVSVLASRASTQDRRVLERMERSARRMDKLIAEIAVLARSRVGGGIPIHARHMDLGETCAHVIEQTAGSVALERSGDLQGNWDPRRIEQALEMVMSDAVAVRASEDGERVHLEVDTAGRIDEDCALVIGEITRAHGGSMSTRPNGLAIDLPRHHL